MNFGSLINKAIVLFELPQHNNYKHFSFIIKRNRIISLGWNLQKKTDTFAHKFKYKHPFIHSELMAIKNFPYPPTELYKCKMINIRLNNNKQLRLSKPCKNCQNLLNFFELKEIWYSHNNGFKLL